MLRYVIKRLGYLVFVLCIVSIILFFLFKLVPGDPARVMLDGQITQLDPAEYEILYQQTREKLGLDQPIIVQYFSWARNILSGDLGSSMVFKRPVSEIIGEPLMSTVKLNLVTMVAVFMITIPLGIITAVKKYSTLDNVVQVGSIIGFSLPSFIIALIFIFIFAIKFPLFPISGSATAGGDGGFLDSLYHMVLPASVMIFSSLGGIVRYVRAAMIETLQMDYIRTARAKGLTEKVVIYSHAFRNALTVLVTITTSWVVGLFGGSVVIESLFLWNGMGQLMITSLRQQDYTVVMSLQIFYVLLALVGNLVMDLCYGLADPRIKLR